MSVVSLEGVWKRFGDVVAVREVDLQLPEGGLTVFLGPSGCGKTTTLRMIAGLESVSEGRILIGEREVTWLDPKDRNIAMVFQNYALYPHKTVSENLGFGLKIRGVATAEILSGFRGDWHCGWDPYEHRTAPQATPLATQTLHAVGLGTAAKLKGDPIAVATFIGDGATSEGDAHEAFNFAGVWQAPTVFVIQNNQFAISVPIAKQTRARMLADRAVGYGIPGHHVDGNDVAAVFAVVSEALARARRGEGPTIVECLTYRVEPHTNSDDPSRYRESAEVDMWRHRDPIERLERYLTSEGALDDATRESISQEAEDAASAMRDAMNEDPALDPLELFENVYATPRASLLEQRDALARELADGQGAN